MENNKRILGGLHDKLQAKMTQTLLEMASYEFENLPDGEEYLARASSDIYCAYFFDVNFGTPGVEDVSFTRELMGLPKIQEARELGAKFIGTSGNDWVVNSARELQIQGLIVLLKPFSLKGVVDILNS